jgi:hypothetical protein
MKININSNDTALKSANRAIKNQDKEHPETKRIVILQDKIIKHKEEIEQIRGDASLSPPEKNQLIKALNEQINMAEIEIESLKVALKERLEKEKEEKSGNINKKNEKNEKQNKEDHFENTAAKLNPKGLEQMKTILAARNKTERDKDIAERDFISNGGQANKETLFKLKKIMKSNPMY